MRCVQCGHESDKESKYCPECGAPQEVAELAEVQNVQGAQISDLPDSSAPRISEQDEDDASRQARLHQQRLAYVRQDYDPSRDGRSQPQYSTASQTAAVSGQRPPVTGMVVFSIINILLCGLGVSLVLGIIALVLSIISSNEPSYEQAARKLGTARILNIIGLIFIILQVIIIFVIIISTLLFSSNMVTHWGSFTF